MESKIDIGCAQDFATGLFRSLGCDLSSEGLRDTPKRFVNFLAEFSKPKQFKFTTFEAESHQMIVETDIPIVSLCEHHIAPFTGTATIGYIPNKKIAGLSKIPRTAEFFSRRITIQERVTQQIADFLKEKLDPLAIGVVLKCRHSCMELRGVRAHGVHTTTTVLMGHFQTEPQCRAEFLAHHKH